MALPATPSPTGRYDTVIALVVIALFGVFLVSYISGGDDDADAFADLGDSQTVEAGIAAAGADADDNRVDAYYERRRRKAELEEAYQRGVSDAEEIYEYEIRQLERQIAAYERAIMESEDLILR